MISCLLAHNFAAAVERSNQPSLKEEPLIIISDSSQPKVVATSALPHHLLVKPGMTMRQAQIICPIAKVVTANVGAYRRAFETLLHRLLSFTDKLQPEYQPTSAAVYLKTDTEQKEILQCVRDLLNVNVSMGISEHLFPARVAAAYAAFGYPIKIVESGQEATFLGKYSVSTLPLTKDMRRRLPLLGVHSIGQFASLPKLAVWEQFGKKQLWIHELAQGIDRRTIQPYIPPLTLYQTHEFDDPITDYQIVVFVLQKIASELAGQLTQREAGEIALLLHLEDKTLLGVHSKPHLPLKSRTQIAQHLETLLHKQIKENAVSSGIISVDVQLSRIQEPQPKQLSLFDVAKPITRLEEHLPKIQHRHPDTPFQRAVLTHAGRYAPPEEQFEFQVVSA